MRICYILLSSTFGMHQYTAGLANRMVEAGHDVHLITTEHLVRDRYAPEVTLHTPVAERGSGLGPGAPRPRAFCRVLRAVESVGPDVLHFTGPHLWNTLLVPMVVRRGMPTVHTLHDFHPHPGAGYGRALYFWNWWIRRQVNHLVVHAQSYHQGLLAAGMSPDKISCLPLTHLFVSYAREQECARCAPRVTYEPWVLFMGRLEAYKGVEVLIDAARQLDGTEGETLDVVIAGQGAIAPSAEPSMPSNVRLRNRHIGDEEAIDLFSRCSLVVLPYIEASQSAIPAAAYYFCKPVIVTRTGALSEYVVEGRTGWVIPPRDAGALARTLRLATADRSQLALMGQAGRAWYERQCEKELGRLTAVYSRLRSGHHPASTAAARLACDFAESESDRRETERWWSIHG
ncbi:MAG: glycosyltransferase family 4 protein [Anaerolineae bacterium]|nr:glycosyltransferase family 4 protein [Anaerolineae bacterium]